jgi:hypothetical protein
VLLDDAVEAFDVEDEDAVADTGGDGGGDPGQLTLNV